MKGNKNANVLKCERVFLLKRYLVAKLVGVITFNRYVV